MTHSNESTVLFLVEPYLKRTQTEFDVEPSSDSGGLRKEGKHSVVHPKKRDKEQRRFGQPPEGLQQHKNINEGHTYSQMYRWPTALITFDQLHSAINATGTSRFYLT